MATFSEANQARLSLKMTLANYAWYNNSAIQVNSNDWCIVVQVNHLDNKIRKHIPIVYQGIVVKTEVLSRIPLKDKSVA